METVIATLNRPAHRTLLLCTLIGSALHAGGGQESTPGSRVAGTSALAYREVDSPAGELSQTPNLHAGADGSLYLTWIEPGSAGPHALRLSRWKDGAWSPARTIRESRDDAPWFVNWADFPSLVATDTGALAAHFLARHPTGEGTYAYDVHVTWSRDGGASWLEPFLPHTDGTASEHGFVSLTPWSRGRVHAVWLDGRETGGGHGDGHGHGGSMTLRAAVLDADSGLEDEALLDARVCDCCQTAAARTASGMVVAYRDRSPEEVRDISIVRLTESGWTEPRPLHEDGWVIAGCPVDGPALAADGTRVAAAWYSGAQDEPVVRLALSEDEGASFGEPVVVDDGDPLGRPDVVLLPDGSALVSWIERASKGAEIRLRRVTGAGEPAGPSRTLTRTWPTRSSGFPRIALAGDEVFLAWTDATEPMRVRTAVITP